MEKNDMIDDAFALCGANGILYYMTKDIGKGTSGLSGLFRRRKDAGNGKGSDYRIGTGLCWHYS
ncbi:MAG: hypothetical protein ACK5I7_04095 [Anaerotignum sp.]